VNEIKIGNSHRLYQIKQKGQIFQKLKMIHDGRQLAIMQVFETPKKMRKQ